jgi:hypothetical protein
MREVRERKGRYLGGFDFLGCCERRVGFCMVMSQGCWYGYGVLNDEDEDLCCCGDDRDSDDGGGRGREWLTTAWWCFKGCDV